MLDLEDEANRRVVDYFAVRNQRGRPLEEAAYYPPISRLTTHPDVLEHLWKALGATLPAECRRWVNGVPALVHDRSGIVLAFGWGTAYALRLPAAELEQARGEGVSAVMRWSGGKSTDLAAELGEGWVWGRFKPAERDWLEASYRGFG